MRATRPVVAVTLLGCALAGCGGVDAREDAAARAAARFEAGLRAPDAARGCAALAPGTLEELEHSAEQPCAKALPDARVPLSTRVRHVDVYGRQARVVTDRDTLFLSSFPDGWRITAAGCTPRPEKPYQCQIKGS
ncbi:hypothetical protein [Streptomyces sp. Je 1-369]|uniref:hypothetical protein n=1 Tax=Streptomyces sp. Je 1-369 TaxID=2966192 RepID=UPI002286C4FE|nr:hypothetical protein [Streptomyces sp. Je 1-369]WAL99282.1 hypothetical protein NOO62_35295 [Streptomyces sp. Je 1-369]